jgi:DnaJ homolog subfamily C member 28
MTEQPRGIDEIIERAMQDGAFDNLHGKGKPLKLDENPFLDRDWQLAYHLLKENGFSPAFIEKRQAIEVKLAEAREALARTWQWSKQTPSQDNFRSKTEIERAKAQFGGKVKEINKEIRDYNLEIPVPSLFKSPISISDEYSRLLV